MKLQITLQIALQRDAAKRALTEAKMRRRPVPNESFPLFPLADPALMLEGYVDVVSIFAVPWVWKTCQWIVYEQKSYLQRTPCAYHLMPGICCNAAAAAGAAIAGAIIASRGWLAACPVNSTRKFKELHSYGLDR
jgi:hypothetical protein